MPALSFKLHVNKVEEVVEADGSKTYQASVTPVVEGTGLSLVAPNAPFVLISTNPEDLAGLDCGFNYPVSLGERSLSAQSHR